MTGAFSIHVVIESIDIGFIQSQVSEHFPEQTRSDLFLAIFYDGVPITKIERAVTSFASFPRELEMEPTLPGDLFESPEEFVSVQRVIIGQICPNFNWSSVYCESMDWIPP